MPERSQPAKKGGRVTLTGKKILEHLNKQVKVFLDNGIALDGVLMGYFYDPVERDGCITLSSQKPGCEPSLVFRRFVTMIQPAHPNHPDRKDPNGKDRKPRP